MSEIIERVAKALYADWCEQTGNRDHPWDTLLRHEKKFALQQARVAIETFYQPTLAALAEIEKALNS